MYRGTEAEKQQALDGLLKVAWIPVIIGVLIGVLTFSGCASSGWVMDEINIGGTRNIGSDNYGDNYQDKGISATFTWRRYFDDEPPEEKK